MQSCRQLSGCTAVAGDVGDAFGCGGGWVAGGVSVAFPGGVGWFDTCGVCCLVLVGVLRLRLIMRGRECHVCPRSGSF